jgi:3-hydroxyacyl-CoA dehydrogenase/enoyl-CoA hydratase/3-hydroxybutyryl-CoA epimerase/enoyl-CoA isomerase
MKVDRSMLARSDVAGSSNLAAAAQIRRFRRWKRQRRAATLEFNLEGGCTVFHGETMKVTRLDDGIIELCFDRAQASINKLDQQTLREWQAATRLIAAAGDARGVLVTSAKDVFIVGADINEFGAMFKMPNDEMSAHNLRSNQVFVDFEDLALPTVVAINGLALGGGLEMSLSAAGRVMSATAQVGLPEVNLGLFPGFGGTVRMARIAGPAVAIDWIASGKPHKAEAALAQGVVDRICAPEALRETALAWLRDAAAGAIDWRALQQRKREPVPMPAAELRAVFDAAKATVAASAKQHQPAAAMAVAIMEEAAGADRAGALALEARHFACVAKTQAAASLVQAFHNDQALKKLFRQHARTARPVVQAAVLGAGIMGSGIAYASAVKGVPVRLKDVSDDKLAVAMAEAGRQIERQVKAGRISPARAGQVLASIVPQTGFDGFDGVDLVIEAVIEKLAIKHAVLAQLEEMVGSDTIIASNTSSLRIDDIAQPLKRPDNFVGMHFFNPVPMMALVEVIKGSRTSAVAVSTTVGYVVAMGKTPVVVKDCPGFLVNRLLTPYIRAFMQLVSEGADFAQVDRAMETFGWPMGPAYLEDVIGIDTGTHVSDIISAGYPQRMPPLEHDALQLMARHQRFGQKNGAGFYRYAAGANGRPVKSAAPETYALLAQIQPNGLREFSAREIVERMMLSMLVEAAHALEDGVVGTPAELDMAMTLGLGFPRYLGGPLKYADWLGLAEVVRLGDQYGHLGAQYQPTPAMRAMAAAGAQYYSTH